MNKKTLVTFSSQYPDEKSVNYTCVTGFTAANHIQMSVLIGLGWGDAPMPDRSKQNWVAEPVPMPRWDSAFAIGVAIAVTIVVTAVLALFD
jgi:hypothetical protein